MSKKTCDQMFIFLIVQSRNNPDSHQPRSRHSMLCPYDGTAGETQPWVPAAGREAMQCDRISVKCPTEDTGLKSGVLVMGRPGMGPPAQEQVREP